MKKILIIEDDLDTLNALRKFFERKKYIVEAGTNSQQISQIITQYTPDIVISDWKLDNSTDGVEVVKNLYAKFNNIIIIFITGHDIEKLQAKTANLKIHKYIRKPFEFASIEAAIVSAAN